MAEYRIEVRITPRRGMLDPQGKTVQNALHAMDYDGVEDVRIGRLIRLRLSADSEDEARERAESMCRRLLANPVTEEYEVGMM